MIRFVPYQDILSIHADYYVNTNNTQGVAGAGLAAFFAKKRPKETKQYISLCKEKWFKGGDILIINDIIFAFTKEEVYKDSEYKWIRLICENLYSQFKDIKGGPISIVSSGALGAGLRRFGLYQG